MSDEKLSKILNMLKGLKFYEWKSIERAINFEFSTMSNRLELTDISRIQKEIELDISH